MILDVFLTIGLFCTILIIFMVIKSSLKISSKFWLSFILGMVFIYLLLIFSKINDLKLLFKLCFLISNSISFVVGPSVLLFVKSLFSSNRVSPLVYILHGLPFTLHLLLVTIPFANFTDPSSLSGYLQFTYNNWIIFLLLENAYLFAYLLTAYLIFLRHYKASIKDKYVTLDATSLNWLKNLLMCISLMVFIDLIIVSYEIVFTNLSISRATVTVITTSISFVYLVLLALFNANIWESIDGAKPKGLAINGYNSNEMYLNLNKEDIEALEVKLNEIMQEEQLFLDKKLTLSKLAEMLDLKEKKLSFLLNNRMSTNFYQLINDYRLNFAIRIMNEEKYKNYSIDGIAIESGFKSKTTFYRAFKRKTNMTPKQYLKNLK